ncbi:MAG: hypothetical protein QM689_09815 [Oscillospiraceae bacterium]
MADKFSIDDILEEYSSKKASTGRFRDLSVEEILDDSSQSPQKPAAAPAVRTQAFEPAPLKPAAHEPAPVKPAPEPVRKPAAFEFVQPAEQDAPRTVFTGMSASRGEKTDRPQPPAAQASAPEPTIVLERSSPEKKRRRTSGNTAILDSIKRIKRERGGSEPQDEPVTPVSRPQVKDIDLGLSGKILPKTAQMDAIAPSRKNSPPAPPAADERSLNEARQKKVSSFILETDTYEDEPEQPAKANEVLSVEEFTDFEQAPRVAEDIAELKSNLLIRLTVLVFTSVFSVYLALATDFGLPVIRALDRTISSEGFLFACTILGIVSAFVSYTVILNGIKRIFRMRADCDSAASLGILATVLTGIVGLFKAEVIQQDHYHIYVSVAILGLLFNTLGKLMIVNRTERNFTYVSGNFDKHAVVTISDEDTAVKFTKGGKDTFPQLETVRKTEFTDGFLTNSYSPDIADEYSRKFAPLLGLAGIVVALLSLIFNKDTSGSFEKVYAMLTAFAGTVTIGSSLALMLIVNIPLAKASKKYLQSSAVILGYSSVEAHADANAVLVDANQLFPNGTVELVNLKALSTTAIEESILLAASLACQAGSILKNTFFKILRGKTEMLYPVESYIYEDGLGLSGWIENKRVLFGTREHMLNHSIEGIPSAAKEKEYGKGNIVLYLSVSGVVSALFVVRVLACAPVKTWLQELDDEDMLVVVRAVDGFISLNFLTQLFDVSMDSVKLLPFSFHKDYERETSYVPRTQASMMCAGHFPALAMLLTGVKKIQFLALMGVILQMSASILGVLIALIMTILGTFDQLSSSVVLCYTCVWFAVTMLAQGIKKL